MSQEKKALSSTEVERHRQQPIDSLSMADNELKDILKLAYTLYRKRCVGVNAISTYAQFANDFINSERFADCHNKALCMNVHNVNYYRIIDLFRNHESLVKKYFNKENFTDDDCKALISELLSHGDDTTTTVVYQSNAKSANDLQTFECDFNSEQIAIITAAVNKS